MKSRIPLLGWKREGINQKKMNLVFTSQNRLSGNRDRKILRPEEEKCSKRELCKKILCFSDHKMHLGFRGK